MEGLGGRYGNYISRKTIRSGGSRPICDFGHNHGSEIVIPGGSGYMSAPEAGEGGMRRVGLVVIVYGVDVGFGEATPPRIFRGPTGRFASSIPTTD